MLVTIYMYVGLSLLTFNRLFRLNVFIFIHKWYTFKKLEYIQDLIRQIGVCPDFFYELGDLILLKNEIICVFQQKYIYKLLLVVR